VSTVEPNTRITLQKRRDAPGRVAFVPVIQCDGVLYDREVDRFFVDLPLSGVRSPHSLRAYGYDVMLWSRFLLQARSKTVWQADRDDIIVFHRLRRQGEAVDRISPITWNRSIAALERLYCWAVDRGLMAASPFAHRSVWVRAERGARRRVIVHNTAYERESRSKRLPFVSIADFRVFRDVGLRGLTQDGFERPSARDRNTRRNVLFAELLITTGLRLEEASALLAHEILALGSPDTGNRQRWLNLPTGLTKGDRGRDVLLPARLLNDLRDYVAVERSAAVAKFRMRRGWRSFTGPIHISAFVGTSVVMRDGDRVPLDRLTPDERFRLVVCDEAGAPNEPATFWLSEIGQPVRPNSWEAIFARASSRCATAGHPLKLSPHLLRHSFAVHMLAMLIREHIRSDGQAPAGADGYRQLIDDPLRRVQRLLGHANLATTSIYLDHLSSCSDTIDTAVAEMLALLGEERAP
jgi:site-specific recombinase XerD